MYAPLRALHLFYITSQFFSFSPSWFSIAGFLILFIIVATLISWPWVNPLLRRLSHIFPILIRKLLSLQCTWRCLCAWMRAQTLLFFRCVCKMQTFIVSILWKLPFIGVQLIHAYVRKKVEINKLVSIDWEQIEKKHTHTTLNNLNKIHKYRITFLMACFLLIRGTK